MSSTEAHKGKLIPMILSGVGMEERAKDACNKLGFEKANYHTSWLDCLNDEGYRKVYIRGDIIYQVVGEELDTNGFSIASKNADHSIDYCVLWFNGGASFDEVIDGAIDKISNESNA